MTPALIHAGSPALAPSAKTSAKTSAALLPPIVWRIARAGMPVDLVSPNSPANSQANSSVGQAGARDVLLRLEVTGPGLFVTIEDGPKVSQIPLGPVELAVVDTDDFRHVQARSGAVRILECTVRRTPDGPRLMYAATDLLETLRIRGGRYDRPRLE